MTKKKEKARMGRPPIHGGYSLIHRDEVLKEHPHIKRYLENCREGLVKDAAGSEDALSEAQRILIDRIVSKLAVVRLIECYIERYGPFNRKKLSEKTLELEPCLGVNYLSFSNSIRASLALLGIEKREASDILDLGKYIEQKDAEKAASETKKDEPGTKEPENA